MAGAAGARAVLGDVARHLVESRIREGVELHLGDGAKALDARPSARSPQSSASASGVSKTRSAPNVVLQAVGDAEDAAELPDILAEDQHARVVAASASASARLSALPIVTVRDVGRYSFVRALGSCPAPARRRTRRARAAGGWRIGEDRSKTLLGASGVAVEQRLAHGGGALLGLGLRRWSRMFRRGRCAARSRSAQRAIGSRSSARHGSSSASVR